MKILDRGSSAKRCHLSFLFPILALMVMLLVTSAKTGFASTTVTFPATQDAYVSDIIPDTTTNASWLEVGRHSAGYYRKSFLQFDISSIPPSTNIDGAVLILRRTSPVGSFEMIVKMVAEAWSENTVTWNNFPITHTFPFSIVDPTEGPDTVTIDVTELVEEWLSGDRDNYGFILSVNPSVIPSGNHVAFGSSENSDPSYHPKLEITFPESAVPDIHLNATFHDYGSVLLGSYSDWTLIISNNGDADLTVDAPFEGLGGTDWAIDRYFGAPFTIPPGGNEPFVLRFRPTQTGYRECNLRIQSDDPDEPDMTVHLYGTGGTDEPGQLQFSSSTYNINEYAGTIAITVTRTNGSDGTGTVDYATSNGSATAGSDYTATSGTLTFSDGETSETFTVSIIDDSSVEGNETVNLSLSNPTGGATLGSPNTAVLTIVDTSGVGIPGNLYASKGDYPDKVRLTFTKGTNAHSTMVCRNTIDDSNSATLLDGAVVWEYYDDTSALPNITYYYWVRGAGYSGTSDFSDSVTGWVTVDEDHDDDGMPDKEEQGPNGNDPNYDGNGDGSADSDQDHVTSMHTFDDQYFVTLESPLTTTMSDVQATDNPSPTDAPADVNFPYGFFDFTVNDVGIGGMITVTLYLPATVATPTTYYKYGPTPSDPTPHWYEFLFDAQTQTGAEIDDANNTITLHFVDGLRGDDNSVPDAIIFDIGGPGVASTGDDGGDTPTSPSGGGGGGGGSGCSIATAAFGSSMEKHVTILKNFRDNYLLPSTMGRIFVNTYYKYSPAVAHFIAKHETLKATVRISLLPLVAISYSTLHFGIVITGSITGLLMIWGAVADKKSLHDKKGWTFDLITYMVG